MYHVWLDIMQVMFREFDTHGSKKHVLHQIDNIRSLFPTVCEMIQLLPIDGVIQVEDYKRFARLCLKWQMEQANIFQ